MQKYDACIQQPIYLDAFRRIFSDTLGDFDLQPELYKNFRLTINIKVRNGQITLLCWLARFNTIDMQGSPSEINSADQNISQDIDLEIALQLSLNPDEQVSTKQEFMSTKVGNRGLKDVPNSINSFICFLLNISSKFYLIKQKN